MVRRTGGSCSSARVRQIVSWLRTRTDCMKTVSSLDSGFKLLVIRERRHSSSPEIPPDASRSSTKTRFSHPTCVATMTIFVPASVPSSAPIRYISLKEQRMSLAGAEGLLHDMQAVSEASWLSSRCCRGFRAGGLVAAKANQSIIRCGIYSSLLSLMYSRSSVIRF